MSTRETTIAALRSALPGLHDDAYQAAADAIAEVLVESCQADVATVRAFIERYCRASTVGIVDNLELSKALERLEGARQVLNRLEGK
jgi:hypothetical protein